MTYLYEALSKPARLYIKRCSHCDLKYFGKTTSNSIEEYQGSGKYWSLHLKKHDAIAIHLWNSDWYYDTSISKFAVKFSRINQIVKKDSWANLKEENGIDGNFDFINKNGLNTYEGKPEMDRLKFQTIATEKRIYLMKNDQEFLSKFKTNVSSGLEKHYELNGSHWVGRVHTEETKEKIGSKSAKHQLGSENSQFGTMWITNGKENRKIKKEVDIMPEGWYKGRV